MIGLGARIARARRANSLTQPALGLLVGRTAVCICRWEHDVTEPSLSDVASLCSALRVGPGWLLGIVEASYL